MKTLALALLLVAATAHAQIKATGPGRYEVFNGTPDALRSLMRVDTMTGTTWVACGDDERKSSWCKLAMRGTLESGPVGRYRITSGTPQLSRYIVLLDTVTGRSWMHCTGMDWCPMPVRNTQTKPDRADDAELTPLPAPTMMPETTPASVAPPASEDHGKDVFEISELAPRHRSATAGHRALDKIDRDF
jgi:hypothetical protein